MYSSVSYLWAVVFSARRSYDIVNWLRGVKVRRNGPYGRCFHSFEQRQILFYKKVLQEVTIFKFIDCFVYQRNVKSERFR
jgi:hypothetical protein